MSIGSLRQILPGPACLALLLGACVTLAAVEAPPLAPSAPDPETNMLDHSGFEAGARNVPDWQTFAPDPTGITFGIDDTEAHSGKSSVWVRNTSPGPGMWQQIVPVQPKAIYVVCGWLKLQALHPQRCAAYLQVVFRDDENRILQMLDLSGHSGTVDWFYDSPAHVKVQAPAEAAVAEVNLVLRGPGIAWFDDLHFGPAPSGDIAGTVTCDGEPVEGVKIAVHGTDFAAASDAAGEYRIEGVPVALPRYIAIASKPGYNDAAAGDIAIADGDTVQLNFNLQRGDNRFDTNVRVRFASLRRVEPSRPVGLSDEAVIDPDLYPAKVRVYLQPSETIDCDHPLVRRAADYILSGLPEEKRHHTKTVVEAVYSWIVRNVEYGAVWDPGRRRGTNYLDVTSGAWQTISGEGWCWGHSFDDWLFKPSESIKYRAAICIEHGRLAAGLLRAVGIPARHIKPHQTQCWIQSPNGEVYWCPLSTSGGRRMYRTRGIRLGGIGGLPESEIHLFPIDSGGIVHSDWKTDRKCMWREIHPWNSAYPATASGEAAAREDMGSFGQTGQDPRRELRDRIRRGEAPPEYSSRRPPARGEPKLIVSYSAITINLTNIGDQRILPVRFPFPIENDCIEYDPQDHVYWTDRPDWVSRTWISEETNPPIETVRRWFNVEFDLSELFGDGEPE